MMKYKEVAELSTYRNYINSLAHRQKHRILSALLILQGAVDEVSVAEVRLDELKMVEIKVDNITRW